MNKRVSWFNITEEMLKEICPRPKNREIKESPHEYLRKVLVAIPTPREERILRLLYGFDLSCTKTLQEVGDIIGLTRERIRQIEKHALAKLQRGCRPFIINEYSSTSNRS